MNYWAVPFLLESPTHFHVDFEDIQGSQVQNEYLLVSLVGSPVPNQVDGKVGQAVNLSGIGNQAVDFGDRSGECLGNLDLCHMGVMYSMWVRPGTLAEGATFLSTSGENGVSLIYKWVNCVSLCMCACGRREGVKMTNVLRVVNG